MYRFIYKCRFCGEPFDPSGTSNDLIAMRVIMEACYPTVDETEVAMKALHRCRAAGDLGIADLIGAKFTPDK